MPKMVMTPAGPKTLVHAHVTPKLIEGTNRLQATARLLQSLLLEDGETVLFALLATLSFEELAEINNAIPKVKALHVKEEPHKGDS